jgi:DNA polymerase III delta prime subunit
MNKDFNPKFFKDFCFHKDLISRLSQYKDEKIDNLIFYGVNNSGKKTIVNAFLNHIFKTDVGKQTKLCNSEIKIASNTVNIEYLSSPYHFEINLYEFGYYDRNIITDFIQNILSYSSIHIGFLKILVINHFDKISKGAQLSLRRIIEKTCENGRFILVCENTSSIDSAILSRFAMIRIPKPNSNEINVYTKHILDKNNITYTEDFVSNLITDTKADLYKINLQLEHIIHNGNTSSLIKNGNVDYLKEIIPLVEKKDLKSMNLIRDAVYKLLLINVEPPELLKLLTTHYMNSNLIKETEKGNLITLAADCDISIHKIEYSIIVLELFILNIKKLLI